MKFLRFMILLALASGLLTLTSRAFASPADVPAAQATTTPGVAERMATLQAMQQNKGKTEFFTGTISAVDGVSLTLTLRNGSSVTMSLAANTRATALGSEGRPRPANLAAGQSVLVRAVRDAAGELTARMVLVSPSQPVRVHLVGTVTAYTPGVSITITTMDGASHTFAITDKTSIQPSGGAASLTVGSRVTIVAPRDAASGPATALGIVVLP
jgi:hypothetical protein